MSNILRASLRKSLRLNALLSIYLTLIENFTLQSQITDIQNYKI